MNEVAHITESDTVNYVAYAARGDKHEGYSEPLGFFECEKEVNANCNHHDKRYDRKSNRLALKDSESRALVFDFDEVEQAYDVLLHAVLVKEIPNVLFGQQIRNQNDRNHRKFDDIQPPFFLCDLRPVGKKRLCFCFVIDFFFVTVHKVLSASDLRRNRDSHPLRRKEEDVFCDLLNTAVKSVNRAAHKIENPVHRLLIERGKIDNHLFSHFEVVDEQLHVLVGSRRVDNHAAALTDGRLRVTRHLTDGRGLTLAREDSSASLHIRALRLFVSEIPFVHMLYPIVSYIALRAVISCLRHGDILASRE